jgi:hypothetical protein
MRSNTWMRCRGSAVLVGSLLFLTAPAGAVVRHASVRVAADALTAMPSANLKKPLRAQRQVRWSHAPTAAWQKLAAGGTWQAAWDRATGVPSRIWGSGLPAPGNARRPGPSEAILSAPGCARYPVGNIRLSFH